MKEISRLKAQAQRALERMSDGKKFTSSYVLNRIENAAALNPKDILICSMRDVVRKYATTNKFITQVQVGDFYNSLYGFAGGKTQFRKNLGDLLPVKTDIGSNIVRDASSARAKDEKQILPLYGDNKLSKELAGVFSLEAGAPIPTYGDNAVKKAEKFAKVQLTSMGYVPTDIATVRSNEHFILCNATFDMPNHSQVSVPIPVQVTNGIPSLPRHFVQGDNVVDLTKENLFVHMKENQHRKSASNHRRFAEERVTGKLSVDNAVVPASLEQYANLENDLIAAASHFSVNQVRLATSVVASEFESLGVPNPQITVSSSDDKTLVLNVSVPTSKGRGSVLVPVDMPNGRPVIPSKFASGNNVYKLNVGGIRSFLGTQSGEGSLGRLSRQGQEMSRSSYNELVGKMTEGVSSKDYRMAEDALNAINERFDGTQYLAALDRFTRLLKHSSETSDRDKLIKEALKAGELIVVPTSVEPYCPKLGLPASKITFDGKGRIIPMRRAAQEDLSETGAMISTSRVAIS